MTATQPSTPCCPACGNPMRFTRMVPQLGGLKELQTFECRHCSLAVTAEAAAEVLEMTVHARTA